MAGNYRTLTDVFDSFEATYVDVLYDPDDRYPVTLEFDANGFFKEGYNGYNIPSATDLFQVMESADYESKLIQRKN